VAAAQRDFDEKLACAVPCENFPFSAFAARMEGLFQG
jgi:hypothetical protein